MKKNTVEPNRLQWQYGTCVFPAAYLIQQIHTESVDFSTETMVARTTSASLYKYIACLEFAIHGMNSVRVIACLV